MDTTVLWVNFGGRPLRNLRFDKNCDQDWCWWLMLRFHTKIIQFASKCVCKRSIFTDTGRAIKWGKRSMYDICCSHATVLTCVASIFVPCYKWTIRMQWWCYSIDLIWTCHRTKEIINVQCYFYSRNIHIKHDSCVKYAYDVSIGNIHWKKMALMKQLLEHATQPQIAQIVCELLTFL